MKQVIPFLVMSLCVAMYFYYIKPELVVIDLKKAEYEKYRVVVDKVKEVASLRDELVKKYESISPDDLNKLDKIIPEKFDPVLFANDINNLIAKHTLKVTGLKIEYQKNVDGITDDTQIGDMKYRTINSSFSISGDYDKLYSFLKELETSLRLMDVTNLSVKTGVAVNSIEKNLKNTFTYDVKIKTYSLK